MKELTIEQKAKAYDEAIKKIRKGIQPLQDGSKISGVTNGFLEEVFPELKESEDERIRKELIVFIKKRNRSGCDYDYDKWIAWLEKQGKLVNSLSKGLDNAHERIDELIQKNNELCIKFEKQGEPNPYSGISLDYNGHTWGMCARDNGVDILLDKQLFKHLEKQDKQKVPVVDFKAEDWYVSKVDGKIYNAKFMESSEKQGEQVEINPSEFDLRLNRLLKQFESLPKEELTNSLSFYLNVVQNDGTYVEEKQGEQKKSYDVCDSSMMDNKKSPYGEKRDFGYFEEKPANKVEPKFKVGDWIIDNKNRVGIIVRILDEHYIISFDGREVQIPFEWEGKLLRKWSIQDAKDGDVLASDNSIFIFQEEYIAEKPIAYCGLMNGHFLVDGENACWTNERYYPATKEQRDALFAKMKEAGYEWDAEKKELKKSADKQKFKVGDYVIISTTKGDKVVQIASVEYLKGGYPSYITTEGRWFGNGTKAHLWTIQDAKNGDVLYFNNDISGFHSIGLFKRLASKNEINGGTYRCYARYGGFNEESKLEIAQKDNELHHCGTKAYPATKEQRDTLFAKMKEAGYEWNADKKELKKIEQKSTNENLTDVGHEYYSKLLSNDDSDNIDEYAYQCAYCMSHDWMKETATWEDVQKAVKLGAEWQKQKPAWSENDVYNSKLILSTISQDQDLSLETKDKLTSWLKSLKERYTWKPSDAQIEALGVATDICSIPEKQYDELNKLYYNLKKLTK